MKYQDKFNRKPEGRAVLSCFCNLMKRFGDDDEQLEAPSQIKMAEDKLFDTPFLQYLHAKEIYLKQFRSYEAWGKNISRERIIALDSLLNYMKENVKLADKYPEELRSLSLSTTGVLFMI